MSVALDPQTEQRIQRKLLLTGYTEPAQLINRALDLLDAEEPWSDEDKTDLEQRLSESFAQAASGQTYSAEERRAFLKSTNTFAKKHQQIRMSSDFLRPRLASTSFQTPSSQRYLAYSPPPTCYP